MAADNNAFGTMTNPAGPYFEHIIGSKPMTEVPPAKAKPFDCAINALRHPRQTKGLEYNTTRTTSSDYCGPDSECCGERAIL